MRRGLSLLLLVIATNIGIYAAPYPEPSQSPGNTDDQVIASYSTQGLCFDYLDMNKGKGNFPKMMKPCIAWCDKTDPGHHGQSCKSTMTEAQARKDPSVISKDADGNEWVPGKCDCDTADAEKLATAFADVVIEALEVLPNILCAVGLSAVQEIAEIGADFVPGAGEAVSAVKFAVKAAKTIGENALSADNFFDGWIAKTCKVPTTINRTAAFDNLQKMPDSLGTSQGCKQQDKSKCKKPS